MCGGAHEMHRVGMGGGGGGELVVQRESRVVHRHGLGVGWGELVVQGAGRVVYRRGACLPWASAMDWYRSGVGQLHLTMRRRGGTNGPLVPSLVHTCKHACT